MHKWTEGEIRRILSEEDGTAALEVLKYVLERVIKMGDMWDPEHADLEEPEEEAEA